MTPTSRGTGDAEGAVLPPAIASVLVADLAQRLGMSREGVRILSSERVEMPAGSLGCGDQPGQGNDLVAGLEVRAQAGDAIYVYRTDRRRLIPCSPNIPGNTGPIYLGIPSATPAVRPPDAAVADLAARLSVAASEIRVVSVEAVQWPDASMGCPRPGMAYAQVITPGYRVVLEAGGRTYAYHGAEGRIFLCTR